MSVILSYLKIFYWTQLLVNSWLSNGNIFSVWKMYTLWKRHIPRWNRTDRLQTMSDGHSNRVRWITRCFKLHRFSSFHNPEYYISKCWFEFTLISLSIYWNFESEYLLQTMPCHQYVFFFKNKFQSLSTVWKTTQNQ